MKVLFIKSPTGRFNLAYSADEEADLPKKLAENLIADGFALDANKLEKEQKAAKAAEEKEVSELEAAKSKIKELESKVLDQAQDIEVLIQELANRPEAPKAKPAPKTKN